MTIKTKLILVAAIALGGLLTIFAINFFGGKTLANANHIHATALESGVHLLEARRAEKNFLMRLDPQFAHKALEFADKSAKDLKTVGESNPEFADEARDSIKLIEDYNQKFAVIIDRVKQMGLNEKEGYRGNLRSAIHKAEAVIEKYDNDTLMAAMLMLRRREKDFIIRGDIKYLGKFEKDMKTMHRLVSEAADVPTQDISRIQRHLNTYSQAFKTYVDAHQEVAKAKADFVAVVRDVQPLVEKIIKHAVQNAATTRDRITSITVTAEILCSILLVAAVLAVVRSIINSIAALQHSTREVTEGDYESVERVSFTGELEELRRDVVTMVAKLRASMDEADRKSADAEKQAQLAEKAMQQAHSEKERVSAMVDTMTSIAGRASTIAQSLTTASGQLAVQGEQISRGAEEQQQRSSETATAMEEMNATVIEVAQNASHAAEGADMAREEAQSGSRILDEAMETTREVSRRAKAMQGELSALGQQAESIGDIINVINDIADQTNLLALNAAIEAARAGDAGRGFAVVADEVRKLAEKTMQATKEVSDAITGIQSSAQKNIDAMGNASQAVASSTELTEEADKALKSILGIVENTADQVRSIATASEQQSAASEEISDATGEVNRISIETAEGVAHSVEATRNIAELANQLQELIIEMNEAK